MVKRFFLLHKVSLNDCVYFASPFLVNSFLPCWFSDAPQWFIFYPQPFNSGLSSFWFSIKWAAEETPSWPRGSFRVPPHNVQIQGLMAFTRALRDAEGQVLLRWMRKQDVFRLCQQVPPADNYPEWYIIVGLLCVNPSLRNDIWAFGGVKKRKKHRHWSTEIKERSDMITWVMWTSEWCALRQQGRPGCLTFRAVESCGRAILRGNSALTSGSGQWNRIEGIDVGTAHFKWRAVRIGFTPCWRVYIMLVAVTSRVRLPCYM